MRSIKIIFCVIAIAFFISSCKFTEPTFGDFTFKNIRPRDDGSYIIEVAVEVDNPNTYNIWVKKGNMDIEMNKQKMGTVKTIGKVVLKKQTKDTYTITAQAQLDPNSALVGMIINGGNKPVTVKGTIKAGVFIIGKKFDIEFSDRLPSMSLFGN